MASFQTESDSQRWALRSLDGKFNVSITSGLLIGENRQGHVEIAPTEQTALLRFDMERGSLTIRTVSQAWQLTRNDRTLGDSLRSERTTDLRLPNSVIRIVGGPNPEAEADRIELTRREGMKWFLPTAQATDHRPIDTVRILSGRENESTICAPHALPPDDPAPHPASAAVAKQAPVPRQGQQRPPPATVEVAPDRRAQGRDDHRRRTLNPRVAALIGLGGAVGIVLLFQIFGAQSPPTQIAEVTPTTTNAPPSRTETTLATREPGAGAAPPAAIVEGPSDPEPAEVSVFEPVAALRARDPPASSGPAATFAGPSAADAARELTSSQAATQGGSSANGEALTEARAKPPEPVPKVSPAAAVVATPAARAAPKKAAPQKIEQAGPAERARAAEQTRRGLLRAADLALEQGRLTTPPASNAYAHYSRLLELDPDSKPAVQGLQSVRQALINRTLAQLAAVALDDARSSLAAAAETGVNAQLVADLRSEIDYRQRLVDARDGRLETLFPADQLVAISQAPPRIPRTATPQGMTFVEVQFTVTDTGEVRDVEVLNAPPEDLAQVVRRAVSTWRFEPVLDNGRPIPVRSSARIDLRS
jgi:TonB family protein